MQAATPYRARDVPRRVSYRAREPPDITIVIPGEGFPSPRRRLNNGGFFMPFFAVNKKREGLKPLRGFKGNMEIFPCHPVKQPISNPGEKPDTTHQNN